MRILVLSLLFSLAGFSSVNLISEFPNGSYSGSGHWQDNQGSEGDYSAYVEFLDNTILLSSYSWAWDEEGTTSLELSFSFNDQGLFDVWHNDEWVGQGSCGLTRCHYEAAIGNTHIGEDLEFSDNGLHRFGNRVIGESIIYWDENLTRNIPEVEPVDPTWPPVGEPWPGEPSWPPVGEPWTGEPSWPPVGEPWTGEPSWPPVEQTDPTWPPVEQTDPSWPPVEQTDPWIGGGDQSSWPVEGEPGWPNPSPVWPPSYGGNDPWPPTQQHGDDRGQDQDWGNEG